MRQLSVIGTATALAETGQDSDARILGGEDKQAWEAGYAVGYLEARSALRAEVDRLRVELERANHDADLYYAEMCRRPAPPIRGRPSYAELCRRRGEYERAERNEELLRSRGILR